MSSPAENEVHASELEIFTLCLPKSGPPNPDSSIQGTPMLIWELTPSAADQLERSIRLQRPDIRRGRPMLYRSGRRLLPDKAEQEEERDLLARAAASRDPTDSDAAVEVVSLKGLRRELVVELEVKRRELERMEAKIEEARKRVAEEEAAQSKRLADVTTHGQLMVSKAQDHYDEQLRKVWEREAAFEGHTTQGMERLGAQRKMAIEAQTQVDQILRAQTAGEVWSQIKSTAEGIANSPLGQAAQTAVAAKMAAVVSTKMGHKVETDDALAAIMMQGKQFRTRMNDLEEMEQATPEGNWRAKALRLGATFVSGGVEARAVAEFIAAGNK